MERYADHGSPSSAYADAIPGEDPATTLYLDGYYGYDGYNSYNSYNSHQYLILSFYVKNM